MRNGGFSAGRPAGDIKPSPGDATKKSSGTSGSLVDGEFNRLALDLFALQFERNLPYRRTCEAQGISPDGVDHWSKIPAMPVAAFKDLELSCIPADERSVVFHSSGTTGQRSSRHFHNEKSLKVYEASLLAWFEVHLLESALKPGSAGVPPAFRHPADNRTRRRDAGAFGTQAGECRLVPRGLALTPPLVQAPHSSLVHMFETVGRKVNFTKFAFTGRLAADGGWLLDCAATIGCLWEAVKANEPVMLLGTAFSYVHLLDDLVDRKLALRLPAGSRVLETGGYKGRSRTLPKAELHALVSGQLGVPFSQIVSEYGMSELSSQAYDCVAGSGQGTAQEKLVPGESLTARHSFQFPPWVKVQIISPETGRGVAIGEPGLLRVFDLANVYSVMAVQTEDVAVRRADGFELIGRAVRAEPRGCSLMAG